MTVLREMVLSKAEFETELSNIASWWFTHAFDRARGGVHGEISDNNTIKEGAVRSANLQTRALWFFSEYAAYIGGGRVRSIADEQYRYVIDALMDKEHGGVFWSVSADGAPVSMRKQTYAQAFAIYALSAYALVSNNQEATALALELARLLEERARDGVRGGYVEAFARDWSPVEDVRLSDRDMNAPKTMNTHLHVLEAHTALHRLVNDDFTRCLLEASIRLFETHFVAPGHGRHLALFYSLDWESQCHDESYGHDIEASWLCHEAAEALGDEEVIEQARLRAVSLAEEALNALDGEGGLIYERIAGSEPDRTRHWWPQAEALVGFYNAYQISGEAVFEDAAARVWSFIKRYQIDYQKGEWRWHAVTDRGVASPYKAGFWKGPYHNGRAMMEMIRRLNGGGND